MEIILVVCDKGGRNISFVLDNLQILNLTEAIRKAEQGEISGVSVVKRRGGKYLRTNPNAVIADNLDWLAACGWNTSVGVAQVKVETARDLIRREFYKPNPKDPKLSPSKVGQVSRGHLSKYLCDPKHSIYFAAAKINQIQKDEAAAYDITQPAIIGDRYSGTTPLSRSQATERGRQIAADFYKLANRVLRQ